MMITSLALRCSFHTQPHSSLMAPERLRGLYRIGMKNSQVVLYALIKSLCASGQTNTGLFYLLSGGCGCLFGGLAADGKRY